MSLQMTSLKDMVEKPIRAAFEKMMEDQLKEIEAQMQKKVSEFIEKQRKEAKLAAAKLTLEMLHKMDTSGISIEFKT